MTVESPADAAPTTTEPPPANAVPATTEPPSAEKEKVPQDAKPSVTKMQMPLPVGGPKQRKERDQENQKLPPADDKGGRKGKKMGKNTERRSTPVPTDSKAVPVAAQLPPERSSTLSKRKKASKKEKPKEFGVVYLCTTFPVGRVRPPSPRRERLRELERWMGELSARRRRKRAMPIDAPTIAPSVPDNEPEVRKEEESVVVDYTTIDSGG